jgi:hypothetical protein
VPATERQGLFFVITIDSVEVDSMSKQSENIAIAHSLVVSSRCCCLPAVRGVSYTIVGSKFIQLSSAQAHYSTNGQS